MFIDGRSPKFVLVDGREMYIDTMAIERIVSAGPHVVGPATEIRDRHGQAWVVKGTVDEVRAAIVASLTREGK